MPRRARLPRGGPVPSPVFLGHQGVVVDASAVEDLVRGLGFGVRGLEYGVSSLGFGVWDRGFGVWGLGFEVFRCWVHWGGRVRGDGIGVQDLGLRIRVEGLGVRSKIMWW